MINKTCSGCKKEKILLSDSVSICTNCKKVRDRMGLKQFIMNSYSDVTTFINNNKNTLDPHFAKAVYDNDIVQSIVAFNRSIDFIENHDFNLPGIPNEILYEYCKSVYDIKKYESEEIKK